MSSYPITDQLKANLMESHVPIDQMPYKFFIEVVGEYEHGAADAEAVCELVGMDDEYRDAQDDEEQDEILADAIGRYSSVVLDLCLSLHSLGS